MIPVYAKNAHGHDTDVVIHEFEESTEEQVLALVTANPGLKQAQLLELLYPGEMPLDGREKPNPIKRPHLQIEKILAKFKAQRKAEFRAGWRPL